MWSGAEGLVKLATGPDISTHMDVLVPRNAGLRESGESTTA